MVRPVHLNRHPHPTVEGPSSHKAPGHHSTPLMLRLARLNSRSVGRGHRTLDFLGVSQAELPPPACRATPSTKPPASDVLSWDVYIWTSLSRTAGTMTALPGRAVPEAASLSSWRTGEFLPSLNTTVIFKLPVLNYSKWLLSTHRGETLEKRKKRNQGKGLKIRAASCKF